MDSPKNTRRTDASKVAMARLVEECGLRGVPLIDCQMPSPHLASLGSRNLPRREFEHMLACLVGDPAPVWS
jgi:leucyl/phenylalanyl-tRNA--protein transferase